MNELITTIERSVEVVLSHPNFKGWAEPIKWQEGDLVALNNSFVFRDVKTTKSPLYLVCVADGVGGFSSPRVASISNFNSDFKRLPKKRADEEELISLSDALQSQLDKLGNLVYVLIGEVDDSVVQFEPLNVEPFESVIWDPNLAVNCEVNGSSIYVRETFDEDDLWQTLMAHVPDECDRDELKQSFGEALDKLQDKAVATLRLPHNGVASAQGVTQAICSILKSQRNTYKDAVNNLPSATAKNTILRISYNFASDATDYIRLIVSICDLKPIVLWGTIAENYALSEQFRQLPWTRRNKKPSLRNYEGTIKDARNSAFHNLFPFRKTLSLALPTETLGETELRMFSEHSKKKDNILNYQDKPLVDVLTDFTRAREVRVAERFWRKNIEVMDATIALFQSTEAVLRKTL